MTGSWSLDRQTVLHCRIVANGAGRRDLAGSCTSIASVSCQVPHLRTEPHGYNGRIDINTLLALKELCPSDASARTPSPLDQGECSSQTRSIIIVSR